MNRKDFMFSAFRMGPGVSGRGLCESDRLQSRKSESNIEKLESLGTAKFDRYFEVYHLSHNSTYKRFNFAVLDFPIFRYFLT